MRWDRRSKGFMEVWYATLNHRPTGCGIWVRYTLCSPKAGKGDPYCGLWGFVFDPVGPPRFAGKQRFSIDHLGSPNGRDDGALARIGGAWLSENHLEGEVTSDGRSMSWSLDLEPATRCWHHLPSSIRTRVERRVSTVCSPNLSVPFSGTVKLDGELLEFEGERGCQSHRWGRRHSESWSWAHCSNFQEDETAVLEGLAAQASLASVSLPTTTFIYLRFEGRDVELNDLKWALRARSRYELPTWSFSARNDRWKIVGAARARAERMVQVQYVDPNGSSHFCANSEVGDMAVEVYQRSESTWRHVGSLTSLGGAHVEFGRGYPFGELPLSL